MKIINDFDWHKSDHELPLSWINCNKQLNVHRKFRIISTERFTFLLEVKIVNSLINETAADIKHFFFFLFIAFNMF